MPRAKKQPNKRQRQEKKPVDLVRPDEWNPPSPPENLTEKVEEQWWEYWNSDVALAVQVNTDMAVIERYFRLLDEIERARDEVGEKRTVIGSQGQPVEHPMLKYIDRCMKEARQLEDRIGKSPRSRLSLGMAIQRAVNTLEERAQKAHGDEDEAEDPRLAVEA